MKTSTIESGRTILNHIHNVLATGEPWSDPSLHYPVDDIVNLILSIPDMNRGTTEDVPFGIEGFESNGWEWNWQQRFLYNGNEYILSGSGYHGGHSFRLSD